MIRREDMFIKTFFRHINGKHCFGGVDIGISPDIVKYYENDWILLKRKSYCGWAGVGMTAIRPTQYILIKLDKNGKVIDAYTGEFGHHSKEGIKKLEQKVY